MRDKTINKQASTTLIDHCSSINTPSENSFFVTDCMIISVWILTSVILYYLFQKFVKQKAIDKARFFVGYLVLSLLSILILIGKHLIPSDYYANVVTELIGIALTVFIIDRVNHYLTNRNEKLHREISLRYCKMPIYSYCFMWFAIYEQNEQNRRTKLQAYQNLNDFYMSDDFYNSVCAYNFAATISTTKTYAQYYAEKLSKTEENFQNILAKYASKLSLEDIQRLEFFGGGAYLYKVFRIMDFLRTVQITTQVNNNPPTAPVNLRHLNNFSGVSKENFQKHFRKLLLLIDDYNAASNPNAQWTITSLNTLTTIAGPNANNYDW